MNFDNKTVKNTQITKQVFNYVKKTGLFCGKVFKIMKKSGSNLWNKAIKKETKRISLEKMIEGKKVLIMKDPSKNLLETLHCSPDSKVALVSKRARFIANSEKEEIKKLEDQLTTAFLEKKDLIQKIKTTAKIKTTKLLYRGKEALKIGSDIGVEITAFVYAGDLVFHLGPKTYDLLTVVLGNVAFQLGVPKKMSYLVGKAIAGQTLIPTLAGIVGTTKKMAKVCIHNGVDKAFEYTFSQWCKKMKNHDLCNRVEEGCKNGLFQEVEGGWSFVNKKGDNGILVVEKYTYGGEDDPLKDEKIITYPRVYIPNMPSKLRINNEKDFF